MTSSTIFAVIGPYCGPKTTPTVACPLGSSSVSAWLTHRPSAWMPPERPLANSASRRENLFCLLSGNRTPSMRSSSVMFVRYASIFSGVSPIRTSRITKVWAGSSGSPPNCAVETSIGSSSDISGGWTASTVNGPLTREFFRFGVGGDAGVDLVHLRAPGGPVFLDRVLQGGGVIGVGVEGDFPVLPACALRRQFPAPAVGVRDGFPAAPFLLEREFRT